MDVKSDAVDFTPNGAIGAMEIGPENATAFTFTRSGGFSDPDVADFVTVNWAVSSPDSNLDFCGYNCHWKPGNIHH